MSQSSTSEDGVAVAHMLWGRKGDIQKITNKLLDTKKLAQEILDDHGLGIQEAHLRELETAINSSDLEKQMEKHKDLKEECRSKLHLLKLYQEEPIPKPLSYNGTEYNALEKELKELDEQLLAEKEEIWPTNAPLQPVVSPPDFSSSNPLYTTLTKVIERLEEEKSDLQLKAEDAVAAHQKMAEQEERITELEKKLLIAEKKLESIAVGGGKMAEEDMKFYTDQLVDSDHFGEVLRPVFDKAMERALKAFAALPLSTPNHPSRFPPSSLG